MEVSILANLSKEMNIIEVVSKYPQTAQVFMKHGMGCFGCAAARFENIEQGAAAHGIDVEILISDLNASTEDK
jgi:hybrid cluster-associated redox disulfide protein